MHKSEWAKIFGFLSDLNLIKYQPFVISYCARYLKYVQYQSHLNGSCRALDKTDHVNQDKN